MRLLYSGALSFDASGTWFDPREIVWCQSMLSVRYSVQIAQVC